MSSKHETEFCTKFETRKKISQFKSCFIDRRKRDFWEEEKEEEGEEERKDRKNMMITWVKDDYEENEMK